jgi:hypothetical protein
MASQHQSSPGVHSEPNARSLTAQETMGTRQYVYVLSQGGTKGRKEGRKGIGHAKDQRQAAEAGPDHHPGVGRFLRNLRRCWGWGVCHAGSVYQAVCGSPAIYT